MEEKKEKLKKIKDILDVQGANYAQFPSTFGANPYYRERRVVGVGYPDEEHMTICMSVMSTRGMGFMHTYKVSSMSVEFLDRLIKQLRDQYTQFTK